jgi:hypothetical protein
MHLKHNNLVKCARVSGIENEEERRRIMGEIGNSIMKRVDDKYIPEDIVGTIHNIDSLYRVRGCYHPLNIMKISGFGNFMELIPRSNPKEVNKKLIETYILEHKKDLRHILNIPKDIFILPETGDTGDNTKKKITLMGIASALVDKVFGIKIITLANTENVYLQSKWKKIGNLILH